jgi:flavin reductase (DIM6/NTAB) family NADH-FMN oxidoreductase RutF
MQKIAIEPGPFVMPMPTVLVGAEVEGKPNFMPAAFIGIVNYKPVIIACGMSPTHHTCKGMEAHGTFSINLPGPELVKKTDWCGINSGEKKSKADVFETFHGKLETAPMIEECRFTAECEIVQKVMFEIDTVYFGEVVGVYIDEEALKDGAPDWQKINPLIFTFPDNGYWRLGEYVAKAWEIGTDYEPKK